MQLGRCREQSALRTTELHHETGSMFSPVAPLGEEAMQIGLRWRGNTISTRLIVKSARIT
jgi:hypothetical protein